MLGAGILALGLFLHVIDLERENAKTVDSPCRTLGIDSSIVEHLHILVEIEEIRVDLLNKIRTVLVGAVDAVLELHAFLRVEVWVTDDIFHVPLYAIDPAFQIQPVLYRVMPIRIADGRVDIVLDVVILNGLIEDLITFLCKRHI